MSKVATIVTILIATQGYLDSMFGTKLGPHTGNFEAKKRLL